MNDLVEILKAMAGKRSDVDNPKELFLDMAERVVKRVSTEFGIKNDEVAILVLTGDGKALRFAAPRKLTDLGTIPVTKRDSIAVNVFGRRAGEAVNNVPMVKHVAFFESVKLRERPVPIQKMVTVPIMYGGEPVGVAQLSRKGDTPSEAGPDFSNADVRKAEEIFERVAPYLVEARPDRF
ncbi:MAG TPA: GAF domain-containing protein [Vicinamibacteria bacterium]|jgi:hypothetical protein